MPRHRPAPSTLRWNQALRLILRHACLGAVLGLAFTIALVALDAHGIGRLMAQSEAGVVAFLLLAGGFMVTFGSVVAGGAVMGIGAERRGGPGPGLGLLAEPRLAPAARRQALSRPQRP